jgi:arylsulfatase A-like enzyme
MDESQPPAYFRTMKFLRFSTLFAVFGLACLCLISRSIAADPTPRPNIILIMADDMGWSDIGRVLDLLDELEIAENTLVLFLSDNGGCAESPGGNDVSHVPGPGEFYSHCGPNWAFAENTPLRRYKSTTYEGGVATPLVARWPAAVEAGSRSDFVGHIIDFLPTFLSAAGGEYPAMYKDEPLLLPEGLDLLPVLQGKTKSSLPERAAPLFWHWSGARGVREKNWKLVWDKGGKQWELYDLATDRTETRNLAADEPKVVNQLAAKWVAWATLTGVKF